MPGAASRDKVLSRALARSRRALARVTARYPVATLRMLALVYGHALMLWLRGVPVQPHPGAQPS